MRFIIPAVNCYVCLRGQYSYAKQSGFVWISKVRQTLITSYTKLWNKEPFAVRWIFSPRAADTIPRHRNALKADLRSIAGWRTPWRWLPSAHESSPRFPSRTEKCEPSFRSRQLNSWKALLTAPPERQICWRNESNTEKIGRNIIIRIAFVVCHKILFRN